MLKKPRKKYVQPPLGTACGRAEQRTLPEAVEAGEVCSAVTAMEAIECFPNDGDDWGLINHPMIPFIDGKWTIYR
jgi:hypothetical protein